LQHWRLPTATLLAYRMDAAQVVFANPVLRPGLLDAEAFFAWTPELSKNALVFNGAAVRFNAVF
jgi:hypothetical protein